MNAFPLKNGQLCVESVALSDIAARFGTPCFVYSRAALEAAIDEFQQELTGLDSLVCFAVKANSNLGVLSLLTGENAEFDIVSSGELFRVIAPV